MQNYYEILEIAPSASPVEIKKAFRKKIKAIHPDVKKTLAPKDDHRLVHMILEAYQVLSNAELKRRYDEDWNFILEKKGKSRFNYRDYLASKDDDESRSQLIFYDLIKNRTHDATLLYLDMIQKSTFSLEKSLGKEDFMDCGFLLAYEFFLQKNWLQSLVLLTRIGQLERDGAYFRHFFIEVEERILTIVGHLGSLELPVTEKALLMEEFLTLPFHSKSKAYLCAHLADLYGQLGYQEECHNYLNRGFGFAPQEKRLVSVRNKWSRPSAYS